MRLLVACECSGVVRRAFAARGWDAWSCDLQPAEDGDAKHLQTNVLAVLANGWDMLIAHPPCTYLASSGLHWNTRPGNGWRKLLTDRAIEFARRLLECGIERVALENPIGCLSTHLGRPNQIIQPHQFGHDASKATCLWLRGLPLLRPTQHVKPSRVVNGRPRWSNQTDGGCNRLAPSPDRARVRSWTYEGIAEAMADQWGKRPTAASSATE